MLAKAKLKFLRISPRKVDIVAKLVRRKPVGYALSLLASVNRGASLHLGKLIKSVLNNAGNKGADISNLNSIYISRLVVNSGPTLKRFRAAAFGRATTIRKRTSHLEIELDTEKKPDTAKKLKVEKKPKLKPTKKTLPTLKARKTKKDKR